MLGAIGPFQVVIVIVIVVAVVVVAVVVLAVVVLAVVAFAVVVLVGVDILRTKKGVDDCFVRKGVAFPSGDHHRPFQL